MDSDLGERDMVRIFSIVAFLLVVWAGAANARGPYGSIKVGAWSGGAFTDNQTGAFSNCIASATYNSGINFGVVVSKDYKWFLAFTHNSWTLSQGQKFPIVLNFDNQATFNVVGIGVAATTVFVPMPDDSSLIRKFRASRTMSAFAQGNLFQFNLNGTSVLIPALVNCAKTINDRGLSAAGDFAAPFANAANSTPKLTAPAGKPLTNTSSLQPGTPQEGSPELQIEAMQIASNFILKANLSRPSLLTRSETPTAVASTGAAWKADGSTGFVRIIPPQQGTSGLDVAAAIVGNDAKECKGKFASARNSELIDSEVVFRGMSSCEDSERSAIAEYFIFPRKAGGFIMFSVLTPSGSLNATPQAQQREEVNAGYRNAAFKAIGP